MSIQYPLVCLFHTHYAKYSVIPLYLETHVLQFPEIFLNYITNDLLPFLFSVLAAWNSSIIQILNLLD